MEDYLCTIYVLFIYYLLFICHFIFISYYSYDMVMFYLFFIDLLLIFLRRFLFNFLIFYLYFCNFLFCKSLGEQLNVLYVVLGICLVRRGQCVNYDLFCDEIVVAYLLFTGFL